MFTTHFCHERLQIMFMMESLEKYSIKKRCNTGSKVFVLSVKYIYIKTFIGLTLFYLETRKMHKTYLINKNV